MNKTLFYIIIISQIWLGIGSTFVHLVSQDCEFIELIGEEEREKEKEIEKEIEKINESLKVIVSILKEHIAGSTKINALKFLGRAHLENTTPPPEGLSFIS